MENQNRTVFAELDVVELFVSVCDNSNVSETGTTTDELWVLEDRINGIIVAVVLLLYFLVGLTLNATVLGIVLWKRLYKCPTTILLLNLVINDLIILVLFIPKQIVTGLVGEYIYGNSNRERCSNCKYGLIVCSFLSVSVFTIALLSLDRFLFLYRPLRYRKLVTPKRTLIMLVVIWLVSIILIIPPVFGFGSIIFFQPFLSCNLNLFNEYFMVFFSVLCVPVIVLTVCNVGVVYIVLRNIRTLYKVEKSRSTDPKRRSEEEALAEAVKKKRHEKQVRFVHAYGGLLCSTFIAILPLAIFSLVVIVTSFFDVTVEVSSFVYLTFFSQLCTHPILETWLVKDLRETIKALLKSVRIKLHLQSRQERGDRLCACHCCDGCNVSDRFKKLHFLVDLIHSALAHEDTPTSQNTGETSVAVA